MPNVKELSFCPDCSNFEICKNSGYNLELVERLMIFKALSKLEDECFSKRFSAIIDKLDIDKNKLINFLKKREEKCLYF